MNREELAKVLNELKVNPYMYSLNGMKRGSEEYCLEQIDDKWQFYFAERGKKNELTVFDSESEACKFLLKEIINESDVRRNLGEVHVYELTQRYSL